MGIGKGLVVWPFEVVEVPAFLDVISHGRIRTAPGIVDSGAAVVAHHATGAVVDQQGAAIVTGDLVIEDHPGATTASEIGPQRCIDDG